MILKEACADAIDFYEAIIYREVGDASTEGKCTQAHTGEIRGHTFAAESFQKIGWRRTRVQKLEGTKFEEGGGLLTNT